MYTKSTRAQDVPIEADNKGDFLCNVVQNASSPEVEKENGERLRFPVNARTPINARKTALLQLTKNDKIIAVTRK